VGDNARFDKILGEIDQNVSLATVDLAARKRVLRQIEKLDPEKERRVAVYYCAREQSMSQHDVLPFVNMLKSIGVTSNLDLVIVCPGGDGTAAETMLDLCRKYCRDTLRVVVPLYAKSAATLLALGADEIVMGETSELGPIDAQVYIIQDNQPQQVSADHFLRARDAAIGQLGSLDDGAKEAARIHLAMLSPAFLKTCEDLMNFAREFAGKQLKKHMFRHEYQENSTEWERRVQKIVDNLTSSSRHLLHGRMITAADLRADEDLQHLKVSALPSEDPYWVLLNELAIRTGIVMTKNQIGKTVFARDFELFG